MGAPKAFPREAPVTPLGASALLGGTYAFDRHLQLKARCREGHAEYEAVQEELISTNHHRGPASHEVGRFPRVTPTSGIVVAPLFYCARSKVGHLEM